VSDFHLKDRTLAGGRYVWRAKPSLAFGCERAMPRALAGLSTNDISDFTYFGTKPDA
jgi:hypothetical protein